MPTSPTDEETPISSTSARLLTADDVAAMLGVSPDWIYAETRAKRIPHVKLGRHYRYREQSIRDWISELETGKIGVAKKRPRTAATAGDMATTNGA